MDLMAVLIYIFLVLVGILAIIGAIAIYMTLRILSDDDR